MRCEQVVRILSAPTDERNSAELSEHLARCPACADWANDVDALDRLWETTRPAEPSSEVWNSLWSRIAHSLDFSPANPISTIMRSQEGSSNRTGTYTQRADRLPRSSWQRWGLIGLIGLAQAAAVLLAVGFALRGFTPHEPAQFAQNTKPSNSSALPQTLNPVNLKLGVIEVSAGGFPTVVDEGRLVVIHADGKPRKMLVPVFLSGSTFVVEAEGPVPRVVDLTPDGASFAVDDWYLVFNAVESLASPVVAMKE